MNSSIIGKRSPVDRIGSLVRLLLLLALLSTACRLTAGKPPEVNVDNSPAATSTPVVTSTRQVNPTDTRSPTPPEPSATSTFPNLSQTPVQSTLEASAGPEIAGSPDFCVPSPRKDDILEGMTAETWLDWVEKLSGAEPVTIDGEETIIATRWSPSMFDGQTDARAFAFVLEQVQGWYPQDQIQVMDFTVTRQEDGQQFTWKNLILTLPGSQAQDEIVILSAHLDSASQETPEIRAPGAEDNGSGSATLLEAARLLRDQKFQRTIQIIWFTGEEQGLLGSKNFVEGLADPDTVVGVVNLDMFGYDTDNDRCFEIHVGQLPESNAVGQCFVQSIETYAIDLPQYDYLTGDATGASDHGSFWQVGIGAIEILENMFDQDQPNGCSNEDRNPYYHTPRDTVDRLNPESALRIARAALATVMSMAVPVP